LSRRKRTTLPNIGGATISNRESPAWVAKPPNTSGRSIALTIAPYPPLDLPAIARRSRLAPGEHGVGQLGKRLPEGGAVAPHGDVAGEPLDDVDTRVTPFRLVVVAGRHVYP